MGVVTFHSFGIAPRTPMLLLTASDVAHLIDMEGAIAASTKAFVLTATGQAITPVRHAIDLGSGHAVTLFMPGFLPTEQVLGLKVGSLIESNSERGLPATLCTILLLDPTTGAAKALLEATWLTALRTGAGIGAATRTLARSDVKTATMIGAGGMAFHAVQAMLTACPTLTRVAIWNRTTERGRSLQQTLSASFRERCEFEVANDLEQAIHAADIVTACTSSIDPLVRGAWVRPGTHVNLAGAHGCTMREGDDELIRRATVVTVDRIDAASASGEIAIPLDSGILARTKLKEIGAVVTGESHGRQSALDITVFKSVGIAAQDLATAALVLEQALQHKKGTVFDLRPDDR
jgi:ornithine cyclodeaminase